MAACCLCRSGHAALMQRPPGRRHPWDTRFFALFLPTQASLNSRTTLDRVCYSLATLQQGQREPVQLNCWGPGAHGSRATQRAAPHAQKTTVSSMAPMHCTMLELIRSCTLSPSRFLASIRPAGGSGGREGAGEKACPHHSAASSRMSADCLHDEHRFFAKHAPTKTRQQPHAAPCTPAPPPATRQRALERRNCGQHPPALATTRRSSGMFSSSTTALSYLPAACCAGAADENHRRLAAWQPPAPQQLQYHPFQRARADLPPWPCPAAGQAGLPADSSSFQLAVALFPLTGEVLDLRHHPLVGLVVVLKVAQRQALGPSVLLRGARRRRHGKAVSLAAAADTRGGANVNAPKTRQEHRPTCCVPTTPGPRCRPGRANHSST